MRLLTLLMCALAGVALSVRGVDAGASVIVGGYGGGASVSTYSSSSSNCYGASTYNSTSIGTSSGQLEVQARSDRYGLDHGPNLRVQTAHYFLSRWYDLVDIVD